MNRQKSNTPPKHPRRKARTAPSTPAALDALGPLDTLNVPRAPATANERTRKRKYDAPPGTSYGLPDEIFHSSDSDEPITPRRGRSPSKAKGSTRITDPEDSAERPAKKVRVESAAKRRKTSTSPHDMSNDTPKVKKPKKVFSPPEGASYGLSDAFYAYTSSEESDEEDERNEAKEKSNLFDEQQSTVIEPPPFLIPTKGPKVSEAATGDRQATWTKPPPPPPTPAHAELPGGRTEVSESSALARARSLTEQYKPTKPSGLRRVSILSVSTVSPSSASPPSARLKEFSDHEEGVRQGDYLEDANEGNTRIEINGHGGDGAVVADTTEAPQRELSRSKWPNNGIAGLNFDNEVLKTLNKNWSTEDEDQAVKDWAAVFADFKAKNGIPT